MRISCLVGKEPHVARWAGVAVIVILICWSLSGIYSEACLSNTSAAISVTEKPISKPGPSLSDYKSEQAAFCKSINSAATKPATAEEVNSILRNLGDGYTAVYHQIPSGASIGGVPFAQYVYSGDTDTVSKEYNHGNIRIWEEDVVRQLDWAAKKVSSLPKYATGDVKPIMLDIGANVGSMTLQMAAAGYEVIGIEAMPSNAILLRSSLCANTADIANRVTLIQKGVDKVAQVCRIEAPSNNVGDGMLVCEDMPNVNEYIKRPGSIETAQLDDLLPPDVSSRIGVVKIDIEGNEHRAFLGAEQSIFANKVPYIAIEIGEKLLYERGSSSTELMRMLRANGYMMSLRGFEGPFYNWDDLLSYPRKVAINFDIPTNFYLVHN